ncbi:MAG: hypothetical protein IPH75_04505 [bacterium]|nr:hypothetical protein [bacterium]
MNAATAHARVPMERPLTVRLSLWWGYIFAAMYLLYGGVSIVLAILDRQYVDMGKPIILLVLGLLLIMVAMAFRDGKAWGWYGLVAINGGVIILALLGLTHVESIVLLVLAVAALAALFTPATKGYVFGGN